MTTLSSKMQHLARRDALEIIEMAIAETKIQIEHEAFDRHQRYKKFVKEVVKYMVMDDLVVKPMSAVSSITSLKNFFNVNDFGALQEQVVQFGREEIAAMATSKTKLSMKLLIDLKAKKVLFAEVDKDFVDFLFHLLSLPVGAITNLLKEKGMNGCFPNLYQSVESLSDTYIQSKDIILRPKCPVGVSSVPLLLFKHLPTQKALYKCLSNCRYVTEDYDSNCPNCKKSMMYTVKIASPVAASTSGFVKEAVKYMVMDDLVVTPMSAVSSITALKHYFNVKDVGALQEEVVHFGKDEALKLLKLSLESKTILTSLFVSPVAAATKGFVKEDAISDTLRFAPLDIKNSCECFYMIAAESLHWPCNHVVRILPLQEHYLQCAAVSSPTRMTTSSGSKLSLKLLIDTKAEKVLFAEADKNCVDFLLRILSLPVSTVIRLLNKDGMSGCLSNLYESVENMNDTYIQSKDILSKPASSDNLFIVLDDVPTQEKNTFYGCNNNVVPMTSYLCSNNNNNNVPVTCYGCNNNVPMTSYGCNNNNNVPMTSYGCNNNNKNVPTHMGHYGQNYTIFYSCSTYVTEDPNAICPNCGKCMSKKLNYIASRGVKGAVATKGGFVKEAATYMVMDDLVVKPMSTISSITLLSKFNIQNVSVLQEKVVYLGMKEALKMLKASFQSNTVLTSVFMSGTKRSRTE
ncbi:putative gibberellin-regulated protein 6-like [Capsicum annuum]|nr:putative gibberellin-regulated protein 6-like [Capsicum annuum]